MRRRLTILTVLLTLAAVSIPTFGQEDTDPPEEDELSSGWEFVPGGAAHVAAGLIEPAELGETGGDGWAAGFDPQGMFIDHVDVRLLPLVFRILDPWAQPIRDLRPEDLEATIGEETVPVAAVDWYGTYETPAVNDPLSRRGALEGVGEEEMLAEPADAFDVGTETRHLVIFVQIGEHDHVGLDRRLVWGHLKALPGLERLLHNLGPEDRVALVSHGSHMELWHDFTDDHQAIQNLLFDTIGYGEPESVPRAEEGPSLARAFEFYGIRDIANTAEAVRVLAEALAEIPGIKDVVYIGWSLAGAQDDLQAALRTLREHQSVVSVIVSKQSNNWRGGNLEAMAVHTGGTIEGTLQFPGRAVDRISRSLAGHYVVSFDLSGRDDLEGPLVLRVKGREAKIVARPYVF